MLLTADFGSHSHFDQTHGHCLPAPIGARRFAAFIFPLSIRPLCQFLVSRFNLNS
jgi:hypothetical protein